MAINQSNFNEAAYLTANPDVAEAVNSGGFDSGFDHYQKYGQYENRQLTTNIVSDPSSWVAKNYNIDPSGESGATYYQDPNTGNLYESQYAVDPNTGEMGIIDPQKAKLIASGSALNDRYSQYITNPQEAQRLYELKNTNPSEYYNIIGKKLSNVLFDQYITNSETRQTYADLQSLKDVSPKDYYANQLKFLGQEIGWQVGQNRPVGQQTYQEVNDLINQSQSLGLDTNELKSILNTSYAQANAQNQSRIANEASMGSPGVFTNAWPVFALAAAAAATGGAAAGGTEALGAAGTAGGGAGTAGAVGGLDAYMASAGLAPGAFEGAAFTMPQLAGAGYAGMGDYMTQAGLEPGKFAGSAFQMPSGLSAKEAATWLSRTNSLAKALNSVAGMGSSPTARMSGQNSGQQIADYLRNSTSPTQTNSFIGQIKGNQNPFLFTTPGQTEAGEGTYDVSGSNLANALRKK